MEGWREVERILRCGRLIGETFMGWSSRLEGAGCFISS